MKRRPWSISDAIIRESREVTATGRIIGDWPMADGTHALVIAVAADTDIEVAPKEPS